jgi:3-dehydroquinate synthase
LAGVAAATYLRGLNLVQVPTSLLSQIDSSLGGKTAVNLPAGKNLVGAFYHPRLVLADLQALQTLPPAQLLDGLAEGIKHAALFDAAFFEWLEEHWGEVLARDAVALRYFVGRNVQLKARLVSVDPAERYLRALLNFGHTVGHALERAAAAWALSHGQAVALGMVAEAELGQELGYTPAEVVERLEAMLARVGLPTGKVAVDGERVWAALQADKKRGVGGFKLPVLCGLGRATVMTLRTPERLEAALRRRLQGE